MQMDFEFITRLRRRHSTVLEKGVLYLKKLERFLLYLKTNLMTASTGLLKFHRTIIVWMITTTTQIPQIFITQNLDSST